MNAVKCRTTGLVIGAGGMAHAAVYSMICLGIRTIFVYNRQRENSEKLASKFDGKLYSSTTNEPTFWDTLSADADSEDFGPSNINVITSLDGVRRFLQKLQPSSCPLCRLTTQLLMY